ncbi:hypothetical protein [Nocardioides convexus]|uniref:hypothetical protein n=1 Tax=Nocardioides convexus TaxID=2712224 RepID=UPI00241863A7|nr:hypothetical protein [Nocardioides convexus]
MRAHDERSLTGVVPPVGDQDTVVSESGRAGGRVRAAAAFPRRPDGRGDLDQRTGPRVPGPPRPARVDQPGARRGRGRRPGRADAQVDRAADRPEPSVRGRDAPGRAPAARGAAGHLAGLHGRQHPQVRGPCAPALRFGGGSARCRRGRRGCWRPRCGPGSTSSSRAAPRRARRRS